MTVFWIAAALMLLLALSFLLPPLMRRRAGAALSPPASTRNVALLREQLRQLDAELASGTLDAEQHRASRAEIEQRALDEQEDVRDAPPLKAGRASRTALLLGLAMPLLAVGLYTAIGNRAALAPPGVLSAASAPEITVAQVEAMAEQLVAKMPLRAGQPDELEGWVLLARTYAALGKFNEASGAYARATALSPQDAQLLADHADALGMLPGQGPAQSAALVARALKIEPKNMKALALAGTAAFDRGDFASAVNYWSRARAEAPGEGEFQQGLDRGIAEARAEAGATGTGGSAAPSLPAVAADAQAAAPSPAAPSAGAAVVKGVVRLAPALASRTAPGDTVFIVARAAEGPRMPLAIVRRTAADLPIAFTLDDSSSMAPELKLSKFERVVVSARVSKSGQAMPAAGDLVGQSATLTVAAGQPLELVIDRVQP